jgi:hypothetical protein
MFDEKPEWSPRFRQTKKCGRCSGVHKWISKMSETV